MEVGQVIRHLARSSGLVRTGCGAGRQDVNVSVTGGTRIEIKGVPSLRDIPRLVHNEALRQRTLVGIQGGAEAARRHPRYLGRQELRRDDHRAGHRVPVHRQGSGKRSTGLAIPLPGFQGPAAGADPAAHQFLKEFSDRIRVIACIDDLPNLALSTQDRTLSAAANGTA